MAVGPWGWYHLAFFGLLIPYAALRSRRRLQAAARLPRRLAAFRTTILSHLVFLVLSLAVAHLERIELFPALRLTPLAVGLGAVMLLGSWAVMRPLWRQAVIRRERKLHLFMPRTPRERAWWAVAASAAGTGEEITYRGVMYLILLRLTGEPVSAALVAAAVFALAHLVQGWRAVAVTGIFALGFQALALVSGGLYLPMAVHVLYDLIAGLSYGRLGEELGYPIEGIPLDPPGGAAGAAPG